MTPKRKWDWIGHPYRKDTIDKDQAKKILFWKTPVLVLPKSLAGISNQRASGACKETIIS